MSTPTLDQPTEPSTENVLPLDSLQIENFRAFRHLTIPKLGRVNLITGKNNVGKSTVLDAIHLFARHGDIEVVKSILERREGNVSQGVLYNNSPADESWSPLFWDRPEGVSNYPIISIGLGTPDTTLFLCPVFSGDKTQMVSLGFTEPSILSKTVSTFFSKEPTTCNLISPHGLANKVIIKFWNKVYLSYEEENVTQSLRILEKDLVRVGLRFDESQIPIAQIQGQKKPSPLSAFGDGMNRIFGIALCLVNSENGILLIDEIENGIHYSALPRVWKLIFETARRLNVQVFATTHSWDCIEAFSQIAAEDDDPNSGVLVKLKAEGDGVVKAIVFDEADLAVVTRQGIEVR